MECPYAAAREGDLPENLVMQSLGSLDRESSFPIYEFINRLPSNEVAQVHRYIDEGAELAVCGAPVDSMASDAIAVLRGYGLRKPMLLAESGAVKPVHTGPHPIYKVDTMGSVLHDVLFAPFSAEPPGRGTSGIGITISTSSIPGSRWGASRVPSKVSTPFAKGSNPCAAIRRGCGSMCCGANTRCLPGAAIR